jgi:hypothetical protein
MAGSYCYQPSLTPSRPSHGRAPHPVEPSDPTEIQDELASSVIEKIFHVLPQAIADLIPESAILVYAAEDAKLRHGR